MYLLLTLVLVGVVLNGAQQHPLTDMPPASEDVSVSFYYPTHDGHGSKLPVDDMVTVLCHFSNEGETSLNISAAMGSLNMAHDFNMYVQNFSFKPYGLVVPPNEEVTLSYEFMMDPRLDTTQDYTISHSLFYGNVQNAEEWYTSTFFNSTVELYSDEPEIDAESVVLVLMALGLTAFTVAVAFYACFPSDKSRKDFFALFVGSNKKKYE